MLHTLLLQAPAAISGRLALNDVVGFTFSMGFMALFAASAFFLLERTHVPDRWVTAMTTAGIICGLAGFNYLYMRNLYLETGQSPTQFRYIDWALTVPLLCAEFYLLLRPGGAKIASLYTLVAGAFWMIGFGYLGEINPDYSILYGSISTLGYIAIVYEVWFGRLNQLANTLTNPEVVRAFNFMGYFILVGWAIYPIGYMTQANNLLSGLHLNMDLIYNFGDSINKIGFSLVIYTMAKAQRVRQEVQDAQREDFTIHTPS
jgi:sensory rhodopsin